MEQGQDLSKWNDLEGVRRGKISEELLQVEHVAQLQRNVNS
jgi:hypothetical protein